MAQTLLFKDLPKLQLAETDWSWMVVNTDDFPWDNNQGRVHSWGHTWDKDPKTKAKRKKEFEQAALEDHNALEVEWVEWDGKTH